MATTYSLKIGLHKPAAGDRGWDVPILATFDKLDSAGGVGPLAVQQTETPSTTRNVKVAAGKYRKADGTWASYAGTSSFTVTASGTRKLYLTDAGVLTDGAAFPGTDYVPLATIVTGVSTITSITEERIAWQSSGAGGGTYLATAGGTITGDVTLATGVDFVLATSGAGTMIGTGVTQLLGFWGKTPIVQPSGAAQAALTNSTGGSTASTTLADGFTSTAFTVSTGGTPSTTLPALTLPTVLTGSTGGSADGAWQTLPVLTDSPASADALRDDIETNLSAAIRNNFAEISTYLAVLDTMSGNYKNSITSLGTTLNLVIADTSTTNDNVAKLATLVNAMRTALVNAGLMKGSA
jgi:hypothetical protein